MTLTCLLLQKPSDNPEARTIQNLFVIPPILDARTKIVLATLQN